MHIVVLTTALPGLPLIIVAVSGGYRAVRRARNTRRVWQNYARKDDAAYQCLEAALGCPDPPASADSGPSASADLSPSASADLSPSAGAEFGASPNRAAWGASDSAFSPGSGGFDDLWRSRLPRHGSAFWRSANESRSPELWPGNDAWTPGRRRTTGPDRRPARLSGALLPVPPDICIEELAAELRRLSRDRRSGTCNESIRWRAAVTHAYDLRLALAGEALGVPHRLHQLPAGLDRDLERLRLEHDLEAAGLQLR
jgi:hypothetical protein